jgi:hypothetical protein
MLKRLMILCFAVLLLAGGSVACTAVPEGISVEDLGKPCDNGSCKEGLTCTTAQSSSGETKTCERSCTSDTDCPAGTRCSLPPVVPGTIANTCVPEGS